MSPATDTLDESFTYEQLDDGAKERARDWFKGPGYLDYEWWDSVYEDAIAVAQRLGFRIYASGLHFSGFGSQGDGASFSGGYAEPLISAVQAIAEYAPLDQTLMNLAERLDVWQTTARLSWNTSWAGNITQSGRYTHSRSMGAEVWMVDAEADRELGFDDSQTAARELGAIAGDLADWVYTRLEEEYDYLTSDETVDELLHAGAYRFDADGHII